MGYLAKMFHLLGAWDCLGFGGRDGQNVSPASRWDCLPVSVVGMAKMLQLRGLSRDSVSVSVVGTAKMFHLRVPGTVAVLSVVGTGALTDEGNLIRSWNRTPK